MNTFPEAVQRLLDMAIELAKLTTSQLQALEDKLKTKLEYHMKKKKKGKKSY